MEPQKEKPIKLHPNSWEELIQRQEALHPDLVPYVQHAKGKIPCIKHPLIIQLFYSPSMNAITNQAYTHKLEYIDRMLKEKNYSQYIFMHERPYRIEKFVEICHDLTNEQYWSLLGSIWSDSENLWQYGFILGELLGAKRPGRKNMMDEREQKFLDSLPEEFVIYRGHQKNNRMGHSWTLSYFKAKWFAQRFQQRVQRVTMATVQKKDVVAALMGRNEFEIVVAPEKLHGIKTIKKTGKRVDWIESLKKEFEDGFALGRHASYHGPWHWEKVEKNAAALAKQTPGADRLVAQLFSLIHDSKRVNEDHDPKHGWRAAEYAEALHAEGKLKITKDQLLTLTEACKYHNDGEVTDDPTVGVCWDADRLDLTRVGITPKRELLSTEAGKDLLWKI